jgi:hypothetical protein
VTQGSYLSQILFNLHSKYLTNKVLEGFGDFKIKRQLIHSVKYADDLVLLAKTETVLQGMTDGLTEIGRCYGMEINVEIIKVIKISREPATLQIMIDQEQLESVEYFNYFGSITNNARCTSKIMSRIAIAKAALNKKKTLFAGKFGLNLRKNT